jgi:hypothetical protein
MSCPAVQGKGQMNHTEHSCLDSELHQARLELQRLRQKRQQDQTYREQNLKSLEQKHDCAKQRLHTRLKIRPSHSVLMNHLKTRYIMEDGPASLPPLYVLKQQTLLISNMMYTCSVLQKQRGLLEAHHEALERFMVKERVRIFVALDDATQSTLSQVTKAAEDYSTGYDRYQTQLDELEGERRKLSSSLQEKHDDATSVGLSDTEHSLSDGSFEDDDDEHSFLGDHSLGSRFSDFFQSGSLRGRVSSFRSDATKRLSVRLS